MIFWLPVLHSVSRRIYTCIQPLEHYFSVWFGFCKHNRVPKVHEKSSQVHWSDALALSAEMVTTYEGFVDLYFFPTAFAAPSVLRRGVYLSFNTHTRTKYSE